MNQKQRQEYISEMLKIKGSITTNELVDELNVSKMTIGRDLKELEELGVAELFYGGAMYKGARILEYPILMKKDMFIKEKQQIAKIAVEGISDGSSIFLETGTTVLYTAIELLSKKDCVFYTNSMSVVNHFSKVNGINLHMVPGKYRQMSDGFLGIETVKYLDNLYFDYCFVGTEGISSDGRLSVHSEQDALTKQAVINHSKQVKLIFDRSKIGKKLLQSFGEVSDVTTIITDYADLLSFFDVSIEKKPIILIAK